MIRTAVFLILLLSGVPCRASSSKMFFDPRIELLGVVQYLAGKHDARAPVPAALDLEKSFAAFRGHPVVKAYKAAAGRPGGESCAMILLFTGDPPELAPRRDLSLLSVDFVDAAGGRAAVDEFLAQLRDFAKVSRFAEFFARHQADYRRFEAAAKAKAGRKDYAALIEAYVGRDLQSQVNLILTAAYSPGTWRDYIIPYPYAGPGVKVKGPFEVDVLLAPVENSGGAFDYGLDDPIRSGVWNELLYVAVEQDYPDFGPELERYASLGAAVKDECPPTWEDCAKRVLVTALAERVRRPLFPGPARPGAGAFDRYVRSVGARLTEYEKNRKKYPTLLDFYPRVVDAFRGLSTRDTPAAQ